MFLANPLILTSGKVAEASSAEADMFHNMPTCTQVFAKQLVWGLVITNVLLKMYSRLAGHEALRERTDSPRSETYGTALHTAQRLRMYNMDLTVDRQQSLHIVLLPANYGRSGLFCG